MKLTMSNVIVLATCLHVAAAPSCFDDSSADVKEFVVMSITNTIRASTVALMQKRIYEGASVPDVIMPWYYEPELGLERCFCLEIMKGGSGACNNVSWYLYATPRCANVLPRLFTAEGGVAGGPSRECYFEGDRAGSERIVWLTGKKKWMYHPPYDPYSSCCDECVKLMLLTPEHVLDKRRIKPDRCPEGIGSVVDRIGKEYTLLEPKIIMSKLQLESAFSNRVFRMNEGCAFQVDYPMPDMDWRGLGTKEEHLELLKRIQAGNSTLMHLSSEEVSEVVYLAYLVDGGDVKGYEAACARCPKLLKPVGEFKTGIGKRLHKALREGGMLPLPKK